MTIIGNVCSEVELRHTPNGKPVCNFSVAVNRRRKVEGQPEADFFRVSAWNGLAENCAKWLIKGRKVCVEGNVSVRAYTTRDGKPGASLEVLAGYVEFLSSGVQSEQQEESSPTPEKVDEQSGMEKVDTGDELPF